MSSLNRMLMILDVFSSARPAATADEIIASLGYARGTAYRYLKELCEAGVLTRIDNNYSPGPKIIELDCYIRENDPILLASKPIIAALSDKLQCDVLLTSFYEDRVVVAHHERGDEQITMSYSRGRVMPLFHGAGSKAIIASLPTVRLKRLFNLYKDDIAAAGMGEDWPAFRTGLAEIRRAGISISMGELDPGNVGVAKAIYHDARHPPGSLVLVLRQARYDIIDKGILRDTLDQAVARIGELIAPAKMPEAIKPALGRSTGKKRA